MFMEVEECLLHWQPSQREPCRAAAAVKAVSGALVHTDGISTVSTVLWEFWADVDDRTGSEGDGKVEAAGGAAATVWKEIRSDGYEGSSEEALEEFGAWSDGGFDSEAPWGRLLIKSTSRAASLWVAGHRG